MAGENFALTDKLNSISDYLIGTPKNLELHAMSTGAKGFIKRQDIPFLMEIEIGGTIQQFIFPRGVEAIKYQHTTRQSITHTQGGLFADVTGIVPPKISLSGTFGYYGTARVDGMDGYMNEFTFRQLIKGYYSTFQKYYSNGDPLGDLKLLIPKQQSYIPLNPANEKTAMIRFYDFTMSEYWEVIVENFALHRNTQRRMLYMYDLQLSAIRSISGIKKKDELLKLMQGPKIEPNGFLKALAAIQAGITNVKNFLRAVARLTKTVKGLINKVINMIKQITDIILTAKDQLKAIMSMPAEIGYSLYKAFSDLGDALGNDDFIGGEHMVSIREGIRESSVLAKLTKGNTDSGMTSGDGKTTSQALFADQQTSQPVVVAKRAITDTDTIHSIAAANGVSWKQLVTMNGLSAPYISNNYMDRFSPELSWGRLTAPAAKGDASITVTGVTYETGQVVVISQKESSIIMGRSDDVLLLAAPLKYDHAIGSRISIHTREAKVLMTGNKIDIPGQTAGTAGIIGEDFEESLYWIDEQLDADGNMVSDGDIATIGGMANLSMQLKHRMATKRGELAELGHNDYGGLLPEFIGKMGTDLHLKRAKLECELIVKEDPRVAAVENGNLTINNTAIYFEGNIYPVNQSAAIQISLPLN